MANKLGVEELEAAYSGGHRLYELCGITLTLGTGLWLFSRLLTGDALPVWWYPLALVLGMLAADFVSGVVHWGFDTWGGLDTPVVGKLAIRAFRQHHLDPSAMLAHDFVETNGHNITLAFTLTTLGLWLVPAAQASPGARFTGLFLVSMTVFVSLTSQIHKWAHTPRPPRVVRMLQRAGVLLSAEHHVAHHASPFVRNYCTTTGWVDHLFTQLRFFHHVESAIEFVSGVPPRRDDDSAR